MANPDKIRTTRRRAIGLAALGIVFGSRIGADLLAPEPASAAQPVWPPTAADEHVVYLRDCPDIDPTGVENSLAGLQAAIDNAPDGAVLSGDPFLRICTWGAPLRLPTDKALKLRGNGAIWELGPDGGPIVIGNPRVVVVENWTILNRSHPPAAFSI